MFGGPPARAPIRVLHSMERQKTLAEAAATREPYKPSVSAQAPLALLPLGFDRDTYLQYNPELRASGVRSRSQAKQHYRKFGRQEGRLFRRQRVVLRYTAGTGLINQHYCHIAAFAVAAAVGAEVVLPSAAKRNSFGQIFSLKPDENEVQWAPAPLDRILDVPRMISTWAAKGMPVLQVARCIKFAEAAQAPWTVLAWVVA